jgi:hypothetical protein
MNLYLVSQTVNNNWDTYDAMIVAAESDEDAKNIFPNDYVGSSCSWDADGQLLYNGRPSKMSSWAQNRHDVQVRKIGIADENTPRGVVLASYNGG